MVYDNGEKPNVNVIIKMYMYHIYFHNYINIIFIFVWTKHKIL